MTIDELEYQLKIIEGSIPLMEKEINERLKGYRDRITFLITAVRKLKAKNEELRSITKRWEIPPATCITVDSPALGDYEVRM